MYTGDHHTPEYAILRGSRATLESKKLERSIGLIGSAVTLVGYVVGASIFILPGELASSTGPAVFVSFLIVDTEIFRSLAVAR